MLLSGQGPSGIAQEWLGYHVWGGGAFLEALERHLPLAGNRKCLSEELGVCVKMYLPQVPMP